MADVSIFAAFFFGLVSFFLSLCILPLIPAFLTFLAGTSINEVKTNPKKARFQIAINALAFVLGLALFFALLGVLLQSVLSAVAYDVKVYLGYIFGTIIILFGLNMTGLLKIDALSMERKVQIKTEQKGVVRSFLFGGAFAVGWTPCVSPFLGVLLGIAATQPVEAFPFMLAYGLGLGLPFFVVGLFVSQATGVLNRITPYMEKLNLVFGVLFILLGILVFTNQLAPIVNQLIPQELVAYIAGLESGMAG